jgi:hypothetical protein
VQVRDQEEAEAYYKTAMTSIDSGGAVVSGTSSLAAF